MHTTFWKIHRQKKVVCYILLGIRQTSQNIFSFTSYTKVGVWWWQGEGVGSIQDRERRKIGHAISGDLADRRNLETISKRRGDLERTGELLRRSYDWSDGEEIH
ncbi:hypothetical protein JTE90_015181 [Oedothorax gibbosus]|uniref:Uncharacterized protein n=1 Tax=Oedothorax gibbosus TaxID=931172 RepID=A0AAV6V8E8_9ARAC|nr:hypothetical protein JTE90_015181 [Oedothorax gibbosus]